MIGICAGHCQQAPGAVVGDVTEQWFCREVVDRAVTFLMRRDTPVFNIGADVYQYERGDPAKRCLIRRMALCKLFGVDGFIDVHCNAGYAGEQQVWTMYDSPDTISRVFGEKVAAGVGRHLDWWVPSIRTRSLSTQYVRNGSLYVTKTGTRKLHIPTIILELFFLDAPDVPERLRIGWRGLRDACAWGIAEGVSAWLRAQDKAITATTASA